MVGMQVRLNIMVVDVSGTEQLILWQTGSREGKTERGPVPKDLPPLSRKAPLPIGSRTSHSSTEDYT